MYYFFAAYGIFFELDRRMVSGFDGLKFAIEKLKDFKRFTEMIWCFSFFFLVPFRKCQVSQDSREAV